MDNATVLRIILLKAFRGTMSQDAYDFEVMGIFMDTGHLRLTDDEQNLIYSL